VQTAKLVMQTTQQRIAWEIFLFAVIKELEGEEK
jgi:hypothetical protein